MVVQRDRAYGQLMGLSAVDGFGFVEFESKLFVPLRWHVVVGLDSVGCLKWVIVEGYYGFIVREVTSVGKVGSGLV